MKVVTLINRLIGGARDDVGEPVVARAPSPLGNQNGVQIITVRLRRYGSAGSQRLRNNPMLCLKAPHALCEAIVAE